jgi:micrococcal nuclease
MPDHRYLYHAVIDRVIDGDTVDAIVDCGFNIHFCERFRLFGINAPEVRGEERPQGLESAEALREWCEGRDVIIETLKDKKEKYGRYLGTIWLDGVNINEEMVRLGLAEEYEM